MASTPRDALRYPALGDSPDVVRDVTNLASDVEGQLHRAYPCLSTARPTGIADGFLIRETDTGARLIYDGATWQPLVPVVSGGGGGATTAHAQFSASSAQSVPNATNTPCAFATTDTSSTAVTRAANGAGHQFTLNSSGIWMITATVRYASSAAIGERYAGIHLPGASGGTPLAGEGSNPPASNPATVNVAVTRNFASGSAVIVNLYQGTGSARSLELGTGGGWVRINLALVG